MESGDEIEYCCKCCGCAFVPKQLPAICPACGSDETEEW